MSEPGRDTETDTDADGGEARGARPPGLWAVALPTVTFLLGIGLGALVLGLAGDGDSDAAGTTPTPSPSDTATEPGTAVVVPDSCLEVARTVGEVTDTVRQGVSAVQEFRAEDIIDLLDRLEDLDALVREQAATCTGTVVTDAPLAPGGTDVPTVPTEPAPTLEPTAEPTAEPTGPDRTGPRLPSEPSVPPAP